VLVIARMPETKDLYPFPGPDLALKIHLRLVLQPAGPSISFRKKVQA